MCLLSCNDSMFHPSKYIWMINRHQGCCLYDFRRKELAPCLAGLKKLRKVVPVSSLSDFYASDCYLGSKGQCEYVGKQSNKVEICRCQADHWKLLFSGGNVPGMRRF